VDAPATPRRDWLEPVARRKPAVAVAVAAVLALLAWRFGPRPDLVAFGYLGVVGVLLTVIDAETKRLPDPLTLPSYLIGAALLGAAAPFIEDGGDRFLHALAGMAALWLCYAVQWFIVPAQIGLGDVKLAGVLGLYLGWLGLTAVVTALAAIHLLAGAFAFGLLVTRRAGLKTLIPFGPFMLIGTFFAVLLNAS
jgi:leader peptidase (prepilin peptidase) / N-methyltransferase